MLITSQRKAAISESRQALPLTRRREECVEQAQKSLCRIERRIWDFLGDKRLLVFCAFLEIIKRSQELRLRHGSTEVSGTRRF